MIIFERNIASETKTKALPKHQFFSDIACASRIFPKKDQRLKFSGSCVNGQMSRGTLTFKNGDSYTGEFGRNLINGVGTFVRRNGERYRGEFVNGRRHGRGTLVFGVRNPRRCQFHQHFTQAFFVRKCITQLFSNFSFAL